MQYFFELGGGQDLISIILNIALFIIIFISFFFSQKIQAWKSARNLTNALKLLSEWRDICKKSLVEKCAEFSKDIMTTKEITSKINEILNFVTIMPTELDPPIIPRLTMILEQREDRFSDLIREIAPQANNHQLRNLVNLTEALNSINGFYLQVRHFLELGRKTHSVLLLMNIEMQLSTIMETAKAFVLATESFLNGTPIGDSIGPLSIAYFIREINNGNSVEYSEIAQDTILQKSTFEGRELLMIRAKGPGGFTGRPGTAINKLIQQYGSAIKLVITIDANLKLEGEKTGAVAFGVGAAVGGIGVEKFKIEDSLIPQNTKLEAIIVKASLDESITTMKKEIFDSLPAISKLIKREIRKHTVENDKVILAGIGNTIGIEI